MARAVLLFVAPSFIFLAAFLFLRPDSAPETWEPGEIAEHLVASEGYSLHRYAGYPEPSANAEPCYTLLLAAFLKWVPCPYVSLIAFQVLGWFATSFLIGRLSHQWLGAPQRLVTLVVALWPPLAAYVLSYHPLWLRAAALTVALAAATRYRRLPSARRAAELGFALGIAALVRTTFLVLPVVLLPWALSRDDRSGRIRHGALAVTIAVFVLSPWLIRNRMALGAWVPGTTTSGYALFMGSHHGADGVLDEDALHRIGPFLPPGFSSEPEVERDRILRRSALSHVSDHPLEATRLYFQRLLYLWTWRPRVGRQYPASLAWIYVALWIVTLPLVLIGWRRARKRPEAEAPSLAIGVWAFLSLIYALFAVNMRFRFESEALLIPYAIVALEDGWSHWMLRGRPR